MIRRSAGLRYAEGRGGLCALAPLSEKRPPEDSERCDTAGQHPSAGLCTQEHPWELSFIKGQRQNQNTENFRTLKTSDSINLIFASGQILKKNWRDYTKFLIVSKVLGKKFFDV